MLRGWLEDLGRTAWRLLPGNPIVVRVVHGSGRRVDHLYMRAGYLLILFFVVLVTQYVQGVGQSLGELAKSSDRVFQFVAVLQLAMICLLAPVFTAGAITQEKDAETFNVLLTTPLSNLQIVLGSLCSRLFLILALLVSGLPVFCIITLFGGVTAAAILISFGISACTAVVTGALAILVSVLRLGSRGTVFTFYIGIALYLFIGLAAGYWPRTFIPESVEAGAERGMTWLSLIHPWWALAAALNHVPMPEPASVAHYRWPLNLLLPAPHYGYMLLCLVVSLAMVLLATVLVRRGVRQDGIAWPGGVRNLLKVLAGRSLPARRPRPVWANPVAWREAVTGGSVASSRLVRIGYLFGGTVAALLFMIAWGAREIGTVADARGWLCAVVVTEFLLVLFMVTQTAATAITRERDDGTLELLLTTPLTSRYILWGKIRGLISFSIPLLMVPALTVLAAAVWDAIVGNPDPVVPLLSALLLPVMMVAHAGVASVGGLKVSLTGRSSVHATLQAVAILLTALFVCAIAGYAMAAASPRLAALLGPFTVVTGVLFTIDPARLTDAGLGTGNGSETSEALHLLAIGTALTAVMTGALIAGTYRTMTREFDRIIRRQGS